MSARRCPDGVWRDLDQQAQEFLGDYPGGYCVIDPAAEDNRRTRLNAFAFDSASTWKRVLSVTAHWVM